MSAPDSEMVYWRILSKFVDDLCNKVSGKVIRDLQKTTEGLQSGDDSGLINIWDEICAQVQFEYSIFWESYDEVVRGYTYHVAKELKVHEKQAIWLQTNGGGAWEENRETDDEDCPFNDDEVADYIVDEYIYAKAVNWSNAIIRAYLDG